MNATCRPFSIATSAASSATIGLAGADVALQQPVHRLGPLHVRDDFAQRVLLPGRQPERQHLARRLANAIVDDHRLRLAIRRLLPLAQDQPGLEQEELLEDQPLLRGATRNAFSASTSVPAAGKCASASAWRRRRQPALRANRVRQRIGDLRRHLREQPMHQRALHARRHATRPSRRSGTMRPVCTRRIVVVRIAADDLVFGIGELQSAAAAELDGAVQHHLLARAERRRAGTPDSETRRAPGRSSS